MRGEEEYFPLKSADDIIMSGKEKSEANKEKILANEKNLDSLTCLTAKHVPKQVQD